MAQGDEFDPFAQIQEYDPFTDQDQGDHPYTQQWYAANPPPVQTWSGTRTSPNTGVSGGQMTQVQPAQQAYDYSNPLQWTPESLQAFAEGRGVQGAWAEIPYWMGKRQELYDRGQQLGDAGYGAMRLGLADSWTPPDQRYMAGAGGGGRFGSGSVRYPGTSLDPAITAAIQRLLTEGQTPVDPSSPLLAGQYLPVRNALERQHQIGQAEAAQRAAYTGQSFGGGGGPLEGTLASMREGLGEAEGRLLAEVIGNELQARRQQVVQALQFATGQQQLALQAYLGEIDRQLAQSQFEYGIGRDEYLFNQGFNQGLI